MDSIEDFGICRCPNEYIKSLSRRGQGHSLTFDKRLSHFENFKRLLKDHWATSSQIQKEHPRVKVINIYPNR